jgi:hypothetical protein
MPVILATQEAEIRKIMVHSQPRQIVRETLSQKKKTKKGGASGVAQGVGPEYKPQYCKNKKCWKILDETGSPGMPITTELPAEVVLLPKSSTTVTTENPGRW